LRATWKIPAGHGSWRLPFFFVVLVATLVILPMPLLGNASGHDFQFHLASWMEVAGQWHEGIVYPRWAEWANFGFGEPRFVFYPPASWLLGAALGSVFPWVVVPGIYMWLVLVGCGMAMWRFAYEWLLPTEAVVAAVFYALNPYILVLVYYRSDFAEMLACALLPLLLLGVVRVLRCGWSAVPFLAAVFAGIWLSNAPAGVIATYALVLLLVVGSLLKRSLRPMIPGLGAMAAGFGVAFFYILPAAWEQKWVQIGGAISANLAPERNFIFSHSDDPEFLLFNWKVSTVASLAIMATAIAAVFVARRRREFPDIWWLLLTLACASVFLMFPPSVLLWRYLPKLRYLQFPWRWMEPLGVVFAAFSASCFRQSKKQRISWIAFLAVVVLMGAAVGHDAWWDSEDVGHVADGVQTGYGYAGTDEYAPLGSNIYELPGWIAEDTEPTGNPTPFVEQVDTESGKIVPLKNVRVQIQLLTAERKSFTIQSNWPATIVLRLLNYPSWLATLDGAAIPIQSAPTTAQMLLPLPAGTHHVELRFRRTRDRTLGGTISFLTAVGLLALLWAHRGDKSSAAGP
jgi:hypothetical protein